MAPGVSSCQYGEVPQSISFSGCGFLATYQLGVAQCFLNYAPWILGTAPSVLGASAGSLVAVAVVCGMNPISIRDEMLNFAKQMRTFTLGPFNPSINVFHWLEHVLCKHLPSDAHQLANGRLAVCVTRLTDGKHTVISEFQSKEDVVQALLCSCFVPGYCGMIPPSYKGVYYIDGGFTSMQPVLPETSNQTLTVSPFSGDTDICPADGDSRWEMVVSGATLKGTGANTLRVFNALYPLALETLEQAYYSGYKDAIQFLLRNDLAPYVMVHKLSHGQLNCNQTKTWIHVDTAIEEDEEMKGKEKKTALTSFTENTHMQTMMTSNSAGNQANQEPPLYFDMIQNALLHSSVEAYLSMFGLPPRVLSYLLFPVMLWLSVVLQSGQRMEQLFRQAPELLFWTWCSMRCFIFFLSNIFVCTFKRNMMDRVMPIILFLQWLKIQPQFGVLQEKGHKTAWNNFSFSAHSENIKSRSPH